MGNREAKELICTIQGHDLKGRGECGSMGGGVQGGGGIKGKISGQL